MKKVEKKLDGEKLEDFIVRNINETNQTECAKALGLNKSTLQFWIMKLGITIQKVALLPGQQVSILYPFDIEALVTACEIIINQGALSDVHTKIVKSALKQYRGESE